MSLSIIIVFHGSGMCVRGVRACGFRSDGFGWLFQPQGLELKVLGF